MVMDIEFIEQLWNRLTSTPFSAIQLARIVRKAGGVDMSYLSEADIVELINSGFNGDWRIPAFAFSEVLSGYTASCRLGNKLDSQSVVGCVLAILILAEAIRHGHSDWDQEFNIFLDAFLVVR